jgi:choline dehydrogenase-like flavoprotein
MKLTTAERRLRRFLRILVALFILAALVYELGPLVGPFKSFCRQLPFVSNSVVKVSLMGLLCLYAAGDVRRRLGLVLIFIVGHVLSVAAMLVLLLAADTGRSVPVSSGTTVGHVLWGAIALDGLITLLALAFYLPVRRAAAAVSAGAADAGALTGAETWMRHLAATFAVLFALAAVGYELGPLVVSLRDFFIELPFVSNSVVKVGTLGLVCWYVARDLRRNLPLMGTVVAVHVVSALAQVVFLLATDTTYSVELGGRSVVIGDILWISIALDGGIALLLLAVYLAAWTARFGLQFFRPIEYRTLVALAEVLVRGPEEQVPAPDVAANVERYVRNIRARRRWVYRLALFGMYLHPLLYLKAPFSELDEDARLDHIKKHFHREVLLRLVPDWWRRLVQAMIRVGQQVTYLGYYNDPRSFRALGYTPFSERSRDRRLAIPPRRPHPLQVLTPGMVGSPVIETDVCVIGSGAAGAILAYHLAKAGREVLVVERGRYVEPREFSEDEVEMIGKLYADGVFQQTEDFGFTVLQGSCVGGSTVVNNAVCFEPPEHVLARWNDPTIHAAGLNLDRLRQSVGEVSRFLSVRKQDDAPLNPSGPKYLDGVRALGLPPSELEVDVVRANIQGCLGCGYCNIGCAFGKKLSMLDTALPWAQRDFPGRVRIVSECEVLRLRALSGRPQRVLDARAVLPDGRKVTIRANTFVVSAGAIASSYLLLRSGIGRGLPVGKHVCFNMGAVLTAEFADVMNAYDGLQISHYGRPRPERGFVYETWWNPPVAQAVNMPGWFEDHFDNMRRYPRLMAVGVLVGTAGNAEIRQALTGGPDIAYRPTTRDLQTLADSLKELGRILFAAGARRVMANTWGYDVFTSPRELDRLDRIAADPSYLALGSGHPQGGNAISTDPRRGVVGPDFRVHGYANLYVCDASVFPSSLTVNPQLTIMSLAHYAASAIR